MIVDTSALLAVLLQEEDAAAFADEIAGASNCRMSAANFLEAAIIIDAKGDAVASRQFDAFVRAAGIAIEPITEEQAHIAREAYNNFGKGNHPAGLNFGDVFAYALALATQEPLLFKGDDFSRTDLESAYRD